MTVKVSPGSTATGLVVYPSGDTTGATDVSNINSALSNKQRVIGQPGGTYYINAPLVPVSHSVLDMTGATIDQVSGTLANMIRNSAVSPAITATDASCTSGSAVLTSATLAAVAAIGNTIQVVAGGYGGSGGSSWYGTVTAVNTGTHQITLSVNAQATIASGGTAYLYTSRDTDITIIGGLWLPQDLSSGTTPLTNFPTCFRRVDGISTKNMTFTQPGATGLGGRYNLSFGDVTDVDVDNINFTSTAGDGVHVFGPASGVTISNIHGNTGDDFVGISSGWDQAAVSDTQGNLSDIVVEKLYPAAAASACVIVGYDPSALFSMQDITVRSVHGSTSQARDSGAGYGVYALSSGSITNLLIEDIKLATDDHWPCVALGVSGEFNNVTIKDVTWESSLAASNGIVSIDAPGGDITIDGLHMSTSPSGTSYGLAIQGSNTLGSVKVKNVNLQGSPGTFYLVNIAGGTLHSLSLSEIDITGATWALGVCAAAVTFTAGINVQNVFANIVTGFSFNGTTPTTTICAANVQFTGTNFITTDTELLIRCTNCDFNTSGGIVNLAASGAASTRLLLRNCTQAGAGATLARSASQAMSLNAPDGPGQDLATLSPVEGDMVVDSSSRTGAAGVAIYHTGGTGNGWKNLYTAGTY